MNFEFFALVLLVGFGIPAVISDVRTKTISNPLTLGFSTSSIAAVLLGWVIFKLDLGAAILGGIGALALFIVLYAASRGSLGEADVKLSVGFGCLMAAASTEVLLGWLLLTFLTAGAFASFMLLTRRMDKKSTFAFAPFMFGAAITLLAMHL